MHNQCAVNLWPHAVVIDTDNRDELNAALLPILLDVYNKTSTGEAHYDRIPHNIFDMDLDPIKELENLLVSVAKQHFDIGEDYVIDAHEIVSHANQFIKTHIDSEEGDLTFQYYVQAPQENQDQPVNQFGHAAFVLVNPSQPPGSFKFENEAHAEFPVLPRNGLLVMYRSYIPHYQFPYYGSEPMVQVVCNIKVKRKPH